MSLEEGGTEGGDTIPRSEEGVQDQGTNLPESNVSAIGTQPAQEVEQSRMERSVETPVRFVTEVASPRPEVILSD